MIEKEQKLEEIYIEIADNTLSSGCRIIYYKHDWEEFEQEYDYLKGTIISISDNQMLTRVGGPDKYSRVIKIKTCDDEIVEALADDMHHHYDYYVNETKIIGHPVMIGDVLDVYGWDTYQKHVAQSDTRRNSAEDIILELWKKKRLPIEDQSDSCVDFIYSLITNDNK